MTHRVENTQELQDLENFYFLYRSFLTSPSSLNAVTQAGQKSLPTQILEAYSKVDVSVARLVPADAPKVVAVFDANIGQPQMLKPSLRHELLKEAIEAIQECCRRCQEPSLRVVIEYRLGAVQAFIDPEQAKKTFRNALNEFKSQIEKLNLSSWEHIPPAGYENPIDMAKLCASSDPQLALEICTMAETLVENQNSYVHAKVCADIIKIQSKIDLQKALKTYVHRPRTDCENIYDDALFEIVKAMPFTKCQEAFELSKAIQSLATKERTQRELVQANVVGNLDEAEKIVSQLHGLSKDAASIIIAVEQVKRGLYVPALHTVKSIEYFQYQLNAFVELAKVADEQFKKAILEIVLQLVQENSQMESNLILRVAIAYHCSDFALARRLLLAAEEKLNTHGITRSEFVAALAYIDDVEAYRIAKKSPECIKGQPGYIHMLFSIINVIVKRKPQQAFRLATECAGRKWEAFKYIAGELVNVETEEAKVVLQKILAVAKKEDAVGYTVNALAQIIAKMPA